MSARALYEQGVSVFRAAETAALKALLEDAPPSPGGRGTAVIAAGGGLTDNTDAMALIAKAPVTLVFLRVSAAAAWERILKTAGGGETAALPPFLRTENPRETHRLLHERRNAACETAAGLIINAENKSPKEIAAEVAASLLPQ